MVQHAGGDVDGRGLRQVEGISSDETAVEPLCVGKAVFFADQRGVEVAPDQLDVRAKGVGNRRPADQIAEAATDVDQAVRSLPSTSHLAPHWPAHPQRRAGRCSVRRRSATRNGELADIGPFHARS